MALINDPNISTAATGIGTTTAPPYAINREWCLGDSLFFINTNFSNIDNRISSAVFTTGNQTINGTKTFSSQIVTPTGVRTGGVNVSSSGGGGGISGTSGDGASSTVANVRITSWFGVGFSPSITGQTVPQDQNATWINVRNGDLFTRGNITAYASDERLKTNFTKISEPLKKIKFLTGYEFDWLTDKCKSLGFEPRIEHEHGVKAQEVQNILNDAVQIAPFDTDIDKNGKTISKSGENYLTVQYEKIVPLLIEAIKELSKEVEELKSKIKE
jgi:hypothetical protein